MQQIKYQIISSLVKSEDSLKNLVLDESLTSIVPNEVRPNRFLNLAVFIDKKLHEIN